MTKPKSPFPLQETRSGNCLKILNLGILVLGKSGVGKSDLSLQLINRGHQLVADDVVTITRNDKDQLLGSCPPEIQDLIERRGIGIFNCKTLYGNQSVCPEVPIELIISLQKTDKNVPLPHLPHPEIQAYPLLGISTPLINLPCHTGKNLAILVECLLKDWNVTKKSSDLSKFNNKKISVEI